LYDEHHESIFRYLWLRLGDRQLAEDLTGDVFMRMLSALPGYRSVGLPFRAWLYRIAHNLLIDHIRKTNHRQPVPLEAVEGHADEDHSFSEFERRLQVDQLGWALAQLDEAQREVVVLRFIAGLSLKETALAVGKTEAAVKSMQHRSLAALRQLLSEPETQVPR
jgi:RNA polymerase sigma-70 factor (ECF subfamily)